MKKPNENQRLRLRQQLDMYLARPWLYPEEARRVQRLAKLLGVTLQWKMVRVDLWAGKPVDTGTTT